MVDVRHIVMSTGPMAKQAKQATKIVFEDVALPLDRESLAWQIDSEPVLLAGGVRALLLQVAHPSIAAGVEDHSAYKRDPWGRLFGTMHIVSKMMFGTPEESRHNVETLEIFHQSIVGTREDGSEYMALDPELLLWVWATLVDTAVHVYELAVGPLSLAEREEYMLESRGLAQGVGVPLEMCPTNWSQFVDYFNAVVENDLQVSKGARAVAFGVLAPPLPLGVGHVAALPLRVVTAGLLPPSLREQYGLGWSDFDETRFNVFFGFARALSTVTPAALRRMPMKLNLRLAKPVRLPVLQHIGGRVISRRMRRAGFLN